MVSDETIDKILELVNKKLKEEYGQISMQRWQVMIVLEVEQELSRAAV
jgi:DNA-binding MarR family transcriptional regulator